MIDYANGGPTSTGNGCLLCGFHHREFDRMGWQVTMTNGVPEWTPPVWIDPQQLGNELTVRLPSGAAYAAAVEKEQRVLGFLAGRLPLPVPVVVALGRPGAGYPYPWSVRRWLSGETVDRTIDVANDAWQRARGWALWKALATMAGLSSPDPAGLQRHVLAEVLSDRVV